MVAKMMEFLYKTRYGEDRITHEEDLKDTKVQHSTVTSRASTAVEAQSNESAVIAPHPADFIKGPLVSNKKVYILGDKYDIPEKEWERRCVTTNDIERVSWNIGQP
jgi:hypothetical protein